MIHSDTTSIEQISLKLKLYNLICFAMLLGPMKQPNGPRSGPGRLGAGPGGAAPPPLGILYVLVYLRISWIYLNKFGYMFGMFLVCFWYIFGQWDTRENHPINECEFI